CARDESALSYPFDYW
nr:immunoglobulin heavy chain junction region [Macaca mulatta]MOX67448.1 immunoglobulin heavy chain junction region [Macaca mulatta]MOX67691.1 immunoglobulin heavy chain junction region [Macaca mulatta]MOX67693.1 immunoglobulin heavy chain junction region [Macaca mulatta]